MQTLKNILRWVIFNSIIVLGKDNHQILNKVTLDISIRVLLERLAKQKENL